MGLLDDAIREHLDLKRRRGADPTEVERAEREALGPVRRMPEAQVAARNADELEPDGGIAQDHAGEDEWSRGPAARGPETDLARSDPRDDLDDRDFHEPEPEPRPSRFARIFGRSEPVPAPEPDPEPEVEDEYLPPEAEVERVRRIEPEPEAKPASPPPHPAGGVPSRPASPPSEGGGGTVEYDVETALGSAHPAEPESDEDVLEETPEFLQDTPDHDRLWFEQRPPRDFDFDG